MAAPTYADLNDYRAWALDNDANIAPVLFARASRIVDELLFGAVYEVDPITDKPADAKILEAVKAATCAQAQWMDAAGDTAGVGDTVEVNSASIGSVSYSGAARVSAAGRTKSGAEIAPGTLRELTTAGISATVFVHG